MKIRIGKLSPRQVIEAAQHDFDVDVTPEMMKALFDDEDARRQFVATKGAPEPADERIAALEVQVKAMVEGLPAMIEDALKKTLPHGEPLNAEILTTLKGFDPTEVLTAINSLKTEVTGLAEKATQATLTAESVKGELASRLAAAPIQGGTVTPQMSALLNQMGTAPQSPFARNVALKPVQ